MYKNNGIEKEQEFVSALNNKKYCELPQNLHFMIKNMFDHVDDNDLIECKLVDDFQKPDFEVTIKNETKRVSLKTGRATMVHEEYFKTLIPFLHEAGMSQENCDFMLMFSYADGTKDGTGENIYNFNELKLKYETEIKKFNEEIIYNKTLIKKAVERFLFKGSNPNNLEADFIYFGNVSYGYLCSKKQILKHIERRDWHYMDNPHIGPLQFRPHYRGHNLGDYKEKRRHQCDIWWANLSADMEYISERYNG